MAKNPYLYKAPSWKYIKLFYPDGTKWKKISTKTDNWSKAEAFKNNFIKNPDAIISPSAAPVTMVTFLNEKYYHDKSFNQNHLKRTKYILNYFISVCGNKGNYILDITN